MSRHARRRAAYGKLAAEVIAKLTPAQRQKALEAGRKMTADAISANRKARTA